eukprot:gene21606-27646_t
MISEEDISNDTSSLEEVVQHTLITDEFHNDSSSDNNTIEVEANTLTLKDSQIASLAEQVSALTSQLIEMRRSQEVLLRTIDPSFDVITSVVNGENADSESTLSCKTSTAHVNWRCPP